MPLGRGPDLNIALALIVAASSQVTLAAPRLVVNLAAVRDSAGDARKSRQRCDMLLRVVIDYLDAVATGVSDKDAACFRIESGAVEVAILPVRNP